MTSRVIVLLGLLLAGEVPAAEPVALAGAPSPPAGPEPAVVLADALLACRKLPADKKVRLTLHGEVGAGEIVAALSPLSCRPIVVAGAALRAGKVVVEAPDLMTPAEVTRLLVTALDSLGLSLEDTGSSYRVVDSARGKEIAANYGEGTRGKAGREAFVLRVIRLQESGSDELAATVGKLRSKDGEVISLPQSRTLLLVDRAAQVERMEALVHALDHAASPQRIFVLPTNRQRPSELVDALEKIALGGVQKGEKADPTRPTLIAIDAARAIVFTGNELAFRRAEALLARIDPPVVPGEEQVSRIAVLYLKHVTAEDLATTLKDVLTSARSAAKTGNPTAGAPILQPIAGSIEGEVRMTADKVSNSLVVTGSVTDLEAVRELVGRLDMPRRQVYVETAILDLNADLLRQVGISLHRGIDAGGASGLVSSGSSTVNSLMVDPKAVAAAMTGGGLLAGVLGQSFNVAGMSIPSFGVVLQALETTTDSSVLSRPHLMTLDHMKATISVGQKVPFPSASSPTLTGLTTTFNRETVALKLDLTPHLSDDQEIRLEIEGEISDIVDGSASAGGPTTNQRTIKTTVIVQDGETIVLGGLQKEEASDHVEKVPILGDIPVLGRLFQTRKKIRKKQDLLIVLTPYVIRDATDLRRVYERKEADRRELIQRTSLFSNASAYDPHIDYKRKRGLLEEINRAARYAEDEGIALANARAQMGHRRAIVPGEVRVQEPPREQP